MNSIEREWKKLLKTILKKGEFNTKDDSKVLEILGYHTFVKNPFLEGRFSEHSAEYFLKCIKEGWFDIEDYPMNRQGIIEYLEGVHDPKIIKCFESKDGFVYTYPERLLSMRTWNKDAHLYDTINQLDVIVDRLYENPGTNRAVSHFYNCGLDKDEVDIPCLQFIQATIRKNELVLHVIFRSNDIYGAWPANMFFLTYIGLLIFDRLKEKYPSLYFRGIEYHVTSAHIYDTDLNMVKKMKV